MKAEELYRYSGTHLYYEIDMCHRTAFNLRALGQERSVMNNAFVESYALHLRNLIEFVYWDPVRADDVRAAHYMTCRASWIAARGDASAMLKATKARADKQVAHLTKQRSADGSAERMWRPGLEIAELVPGLRLFLQHARPELLHPNVAAAVARLAALVEASDGPSR